MIVHDFIQISISKIGITDITKVESLNVTSSFNYRKIWYEGCIFSVLHEKCMGTPRLPGLDRFDPLGVPIHFEAKKAENTYPRSKVHFFELKI